MRRGGEKQEKRSMRVKGRQVNTVIFVSYFARYDMSRLEIRLMLET